MDYQKHYNLLIQTRQKENRIKGQGIYYESHHIIPKGLGGSNNKDNLVLLTPREHFIAHWLLYRIYKNKATASAFYRMCHNGNKNMKRYIPSARIYEEARLAYIEKNKNKKKHTDYSKKQIGIKNSKPKPKEYGKNLSLLMKQGLAKKISESNKGVSRGKGRKVTWAKGRPKTTIIQMDVNQNILKVWEGTEEIGKVFSLPSIYSSFKSKKQYKNYLWKKQDVLNQKTEQ